MRKPHKKRLIRKLHYTVISNKRYFFEFRMKFGKQPPLALQRKPFCKRIKIAAIGILLSHKVLQKVMNGG
jgi:hypothetical protein